jgi:hypothetical protein
MIISYITFLGGAVAYFQNKFPRIAKDVYKADLFFAIIWSAPMAAIWFFGVPIFYYLSEGMKYGWQLRSNDSLKINA